MKEGPQLDGQPSLIEEIPLQDSRRLQEPFLGPGEDQTAEAEGLHLLARNLEGQVR